MKKLPPESLKYPLYLYFKIWEQMIVPEEWKSTTIIPLLKKGRDPKDFRSYMPVVLTNILRKIFKRMTGLASGKGEKINDR